MPDMTAKELFAFACDQDRLLVARIDARQDLLDKAKKSKKSVTKLLGLDEDGLTKWIAVLALELPAAEPEADPLDEPVQQAEPAAKKPAAKKAPKVTDPNRGLISALVRKLLVETTDTYPEIEAQVKATYPEAKTTTRSIASVASDMRKAGQSVAQRRPKAA